MNSLSTEIKKVADQIRGVTYGANDAIDKPQNGYIGLLRANNIQNNCLNFDDLLYVPSHKVSSTQILKRGDILIAASSGSLSIVGKAGVFKSDEKYTFGAFCKAIRPRTNIVASYLSHYFFTTEYRTIISSLAAGANINNLRNEHIDNLSIPLPPLAEQQRIAALLDTADRILKQRESAIAKLDQLAQSVFVEMFGDPVRNTKNFPMKNIGELPIHIADGNYSSKYPSASEFVESGIPFIRANNLKNLTLVNDDVRYITEKKHGELAKGHLKFRDMVIVTRGEIGKVGLVPMEFDDANMNAQLVLLRPNYSMLLPEYLCHFFNNNYTKSYVKNFETGVALKQLPIGNLKKIQICLPPIGLQNEFANIVKKIENQFESLNVQKANINSMLLSLQHQSFAVN